VVVCNFSDEIGENGADGFPSRAQAEWTVWESKEPTGSGATRPHNNALSMTEGDPALGQIVWRQFQGDPVAGQNSDPVPPQSTGQVSQNDAIMLELHAEQTARELFQNSSGYFYAVFLAHKPLKIEIENSPAARCAAARQQPAHRAAIYGFNPQSHWPPADPSVRA
jgi:hypothetical protein